MIKLYSRNNIFKTCYLFMLESRAQILQFTRGSGFTVHVPLEFYRILRHMKLSTDMSELSRANVNWNACRFIGRYT